MTEKKKFDEKKKFRRKQIWSRNLFSEKNSEQKRFLAFSGRDLAKKFFGRFYITSSYFGLGENFCPISTFFQVFGIM